MNLYRILIPLFIIFIISIAISISPYVGTNPPQGQYHLFSEIWINESTIDWLGISHVGLGNLVPSANGTYDIGNENLWFRNAYIKTLYVENLVGNVSGGGGGNLSGYGVEDFIAKWKDSSTLVPSVLKDTGNSLWTNVSFKIEESISYPYLNPSSLIVASGKGDAITGYTTVSGRAAIYGIAGSSESWAGYFEGGKGLYASDAEVGNKLTTPNLYVNTIYSGSGSYFKIANTLFVYDTLNTDKYDFDIRIGGDWANALYIDTAEGAGLVDLVAGAYWNGTTYVYGGTRGASRIRLHDGEISFYVGETSGTAGSPVPFVIVLYMTKYFVASYKEFRAPTFKDINDLNYYVDPAGTSKLKDLIITGYIKDSTWNNRIYFDTANKNVIIYVG